MWIILALLSRFLWAGCNAVDQVLSRAHRAHKTAAVTALELSMDLPIALVALALGGTGGHGGAFYGWIALGVVSQFAALIPYYKCMQEEEAYNIVPYMEMVPVFLTAMAVFVRGEHMGPVQLAAAGLIILCGFLFSWDFAHGRFKPRIFALMAVCSFFFAAAQFTMREAEEAASVWRVTGVFLLGSAATGFMLLLARPEVRRIVVSTAIETKGRTVALSLFSNTMAFLGIVSMLSAFARAPTMGHAAGLSGVQSFFSFFIAVALGRLLPRHFERIGFGRETKAKLFLLVGILLGAWILGNG